MGDGITELTSSGGEVYASTGTTGPIQSRPWRGDGSRERDEFDKEAAEHIQVELLGAGSYPESGAKIRVSANGQLLTIEYGGSHGKTLYGINWQEVDNLVGRLLTLCDATFTDQVQRKAFKDMVRQHVKEWMAIIVADASYDAGLEHNGSAPFTAMVTEPE